MNENVTTASPIIAKKKKRLVVFLIVLGFFGVSTLSAAVWYRHHFHANEFEPVQLSLAEKQEVTAKLQRLDDTEAHSFPPSDPRKTIIINEREINGFLQEQGYGEKVKIHIRKSGLGANIVTPINHDFPILGGKTLRLNIDFNAQLNSNQQLHLSLADVSIGGISLPNAWLANLKGLNLLDQQANNDNPSIVTFAAGIKSVDIRNGELRIVLAE